MRLEILANSDDVAGSRAQVVHQLDDLRKSLTQADYDTALRKHASIFTVAPRSSALQQRQRLLIDRVRPDAPVQPRDRLRVVIEHVWLRVENSVERRFVAVEVGNEHFNLAFR